MRLTEEGLGHFSLRGFPGVEPPLRGLHELGLYLSEFHSRLAQEIYIYERFHGTVGLIVYSSMGTSRYKVVHNLWRSGSEEWIEKHNDCSACRRDLHKNRIIGRTRCKGA